jgi:RNAse (barnase) inhibitor barstar
MQPPSILFQTSEPWVLKTYDSFEELTRWLQPQLSEEKGFRLITIDGHKMQTASTFYDELISIFKLPNYFGRNLNALSECLSDLEWIKSSGFIILIQNAEDVLRLEAPEKLEGFLDTLKSAGNEWRQAVNYGTTWNRTPTPFHAVLLCNKHSWMDEIPAFTVK